ncbi:uncharacterized protein LOC111871658 isoform X2 [Cryptotermes secundus]|uniref:uncharacterized protein LOC111871658 isoform X2 n=1 Tax=Cryptotermes secundus TaxID=105785 RepID=UPI000CD7B6D1|nr:uncharacterized protein LOC111871658 isoform X2 [Cryptotermes secundus]
MYTLPYSVVLDSVAEMSSNVGQASGILANNSTSSGGHFFHRGVQQSPVFNPLISNQGQSLYNGVFSTQTGYTSQSSFSTTNFSTYSHVEPHPWMSETRVMPAVNSTLQQIERDRGSRAQYSEKTVSCSGQSLAHTCCGNRIGIAENIGMCSPVSAETYRTVSKELLSIQSKSNNSLDSQGWFCSQGMIGYGIQQNQNTPQLPSCSVSQINMLLQEQPEHKHSSDSCFDHSQTQSSNTNKQSNQCSNNGLVKSDCIEQNKEQGIKYCNLQKVQQNGQPIEHTQLPVQLKQQEQSGYVGHSSLYGPAGELHEDILYSQASLVPHSGSDGSHNTGRFQAHFISSKHQNTLTDTMSPVLQHFQDHGRCGLDAGIPCDVMDSCLQTDIKSVNVSSSASCCQLSMEPACNQTVFGMQRSAVNYQSNCNSSVTGGVQLCSSTHQLQIQFSEADGKENSNQESSSVTGESDIIVEETEEEMTESEISIEEIKGTVFTQQEPARCLVCSLSANANNQFIHMQGNSPVTSASHIPVVKPSQLGPTDRATPYLQTPAPTQDRVYKPSTG